MAKFTWLPEEKARVLKKQEQYLSLIGNDIRLGILHLLKDSTHKVSFNEIAKKIGIQNNKLAYHISLLKKGRFIENELRFNNKVAKSFSFYGLSRKGIKTIDLIEQMVKD